MALVSVRRVSVRCRPPESRPQPLGQIGDDLPVVVGSKGERQCERHFVGTLKSGVGYS
jgi:hypothetical protein